MSALIDRVNSLPTPSPSKGNEASIQKREKPSKLICPECQDEGGIFIMSNDGHRCGDCGRQVTTVDAMQAAEADKAEEAAAEVATPKAAEEIKAVSPDTPEVKELISEIEM